MYHTFISLFTNMYWVPSNSQTIFGALTCNNRDNKQTYDLIVIKFNGVPRNQQTTVFYNIYYTGI